MTVNLQKPQSRAFEKRDKARAKLQHYRDVCRLVSIRDGWQCRCCHSPKTAHHHHLTFRSQGGNDTTDNLVLLCTICHADIHAYRLSIWGTDANGPLEFKRAQ